MGYLIEPVGHVRGGRNTTEDDDWGDVVATIELTDAFGSDSLAGLAAFSHAEIVFLFDRVPIDTLETGARHPRGRSDWPLVGIFAQRGKNRPNRVGVTIAQIKSVAGNRLEVCGLDACDGTPVIDIKPVLSGFLPRGNFKEPAWSRELMQNYW